jgi:NADH:ubiquinone oxidoreductase subunit 4 (subunit M)
MYLPQELWLAEFHELGLFTAKDVLAFVMQEVRLLPVYLIPCIIFLLSYLLAVRSKA